MMEVELSETGCVALLNVEDKKSKCMHYLHEAKQFYVSFKLEKYEHAFVIEENMITLQ